MRKKLYVVEDDYHQAQWTADLLKEEFGEAVELERISTQHEFLTRFEEIALRQPACIILDVMLPWTDKEVSEEPSSVDSFMTAGIQCCRKLRGDSRTANTQVLIYTVMDRSDLPGLPDRIVHLRKDAPDSRLIAWVKDCMG